MIIESSNHYQRRSKEQSSIASRWLAPTSRRVLRHTSRRASRRTSGAQKSSPVLRAAGLHPQPSRNLSQAREKTRQRRTPKRLTALSCPHWRSDRDSNSGTACDGYTLSRRASSATRAPLLIFTQNNLSSKKRCKDNAFFLI